MPVLWRGVWSLRALFFRYCVGIYCGSLLISRLCVMVGQMFNGRLQSAGPANKSLVGDPKSGTFSCVLPCVGESIFIVWSGAGRHNSTVGRRGAHK